MAPSAKRTSITWGKRIIMAAIIVIGGGYIVLSLAERSTDSIRLGFQDYMSRASGHEAEITELSRAQMVPDMAFRMKGVLIRDKSARDKVLISAKEAYIAVPLWRMLTGLPRYIGFEVRDLSIASGFFMPMKTTISFAGISDPTPDSKLPQFIVEGDYNGQEILVTAQMERSQSSRYYLYQLPGEFPFTFKIGKIEGAGTYDRRLTDVIINPLTITHGGHTATMNMILTGEKEISARIEGNVDGAIFKGDVSGDAPQRVLTIIPEEEGGKDAETIEIFVQAMMDDLGLKNQESDPLRVVVGKQPIQDIQKTGK